MTKTPFFSFVIPAHNEEGYIAETLACLARLDYPKNSYEVIVVENGSTDQTAARAKSVAQTGVTILSIAGKGVSNARNEGVRHVSKTADWVFFLDADTHIDPPFLREVTAFIESHASVPYVLGSANLGPWPRSRFMDFWYTLANLGTWIRGSSYAGLMLVKHEVLLAGVHFDEGMEVGEDLRFSSEAKKHGKSFFLWTRSAHTSTRRYSKDAWKKFPMWVGVWLFAMMVPIHVQRRFKYKVIR
jgi:glycosyltransferase involved in cell wall biosynthesis